MYDMIDKLDKTYVMFVLESMNITPYQLSKMTGISGATYSRLLADKQNLSWSSIATIEKETGIAFKSQEHIIYANELSFCPNSNNEKGTRNGPVERKENI